MDPRIVAHRAGPLRRGVAWHAEQTLPAFADVPTSLLVADGTAGTGVPTAAACGATAVGLRWPVAPDDIAGARARGSR